MFHIILLNLSLKKVIERINLLNLKHLLSFTYFFKYRYISRLMNIKRVKQGTSITFYNGVYMIFLGIFFMFFSNFNMKNNFESILQLWGFFIIYSPSISKLFILFNILIGLLLISNGIFIIYLSDFIYKRKEKFTWVVLFLSSIISWASLLTIFILMKNSVLAFLIFIGWISFIFGMIIPIKYYLEKDYKEY